ncbi:MAG: serine/threonine protein kinase [Aquimonas sp.]|nr:serine/threonine protein kinase [Aquimonas sp.]
MPDPMDSPCADADLATQALAVPAVDGMASAGQPWTAGMRLGDYRIESLIAAGGMGEVYRATQLQPVQRTVAIKRLKARQLDLRQRTWFELERQLLAQMQHPAIAQLFDAGTLDDGTPYLVMEYIDGVPLTRFCREQQLGLVQRVELFLQLLEGVQHAHQRGVIHRDLKPANVLVTGRDRPLPKLIDFGIASAEGSADGQAGTPEYMSPEQSDTALGALDIRSDIYSLGVVLFELLTGERPARSSREIAAHTQSQPMTRASEGLAKRALGTQRQWATAMQMPLRHLARALRSELDWIVIRATALDRANRYSTVAAFADDLRRFLRRQPLAAHPGGRWYRARKFARRHVLALVSALSVLLALLLGLSMALLGLREAREQRSEAEARGRELQQVVGFQKRMLASLDPGALGQGILALQRDLVERTPAYRAMDADAQGSLQRVFDLTDPVDLARNVLDQQILQQALATIERDFAEQPGLAGELRGSVADTYEGIGNARMAADLLGELVSKHAASHAEHDPRSLETLGRWIVALQASGQIAEAQQAAALADSRLDVLDSHTRQWIDLQFVLAQVDMDAGRFVEAERRLSSALQRQHLASLADNTALRSKLLSRHALVLLRLNRVDEAGKQIEATLNALSTEEALTLEQMQILNNVIPIRAEMGDIEGALEISERLYERSQVLLGREHPFSLLQLSNSGASLVRLQRYQEANEALRQVVELRDRVLGARHPLSLRARANFAASLARAVQDADPGPARTAALQEAVVLLREVVAARVDLLGERHPDTLQSIASVASVLGFLGDPSEALALVDGVVDIRTNDLGEGHPETLNVMELRGRLQAQAGWHQAARRDFLAVLSGRQSAYEIGHPQILAAAWNLTGLPVSALTSDDIALLRDQIFAPLLQMDTASLQPPVRAQLERVREWISTH